MTKWNTAVGDTFVSNTSLKLLTVSIPSVSRLRLPLKRTTKWGNYLCGPSPFPSSNTLVYPTSVVWNSQPAVLFLTRERWKAKHQRL